VVIRIFHIKQQQNSIQYKNGVRRVKPAKYCVKHVRGTPESHISFFLFCEWLYSAGRNRQSNGGQGRESCRWYMPGSVKGEPYGSRRRMQTISERTGQKTWTRQPICRRRFEVATLGISADAARSNQVRPTSSRLFFLGGRGVALQWSAMQLSRALTA